MIREQVELRFIGITTRSKRRVIRRIEKNFFLGLEIDFL